MHAFSFFARAYDARMRTITREGFAREIIFSSKSERTTLIPFMFDSDVLGWAEEVDQRKNAHNSGNSESLLISFFKYKCQIFIHIILIFYVVNFSLQIGLEIQNKKVFFSNQVMFVYCIE
ncbi:Hypothetical_protein [Hexamita inflata]|uniref:Hypothetical_protein n=1 Tax=Hexamita inflata TaxID=28002 RepID=A0AA86N5E4_9EUKA|nr:Hypothetical protein HINF_LOCUS529 [Hexamita inflata]